MTKIKATAKPHPSAAAFRADPMLPRIERVVADVLINGKVVAPVDVLVGMGLLRGDHLDDWRRGRVPYLERVITCNLSRLARLLRLLRFQAHDLNLKPSTTVYMRHGKGPKQRLRFTKTGDPNLELAYATHFVWPGKQPCHPPRAVAATEVSAEPTGKLVADAAARCLRIFDAEALRQVDAQAEAQRREAERRSPAEMTRCRAGDVD